MISKIVNNDEFDPSTISKLVNPVNIIDDDRNILDEFDQEAEPVDEAQIDDSGDVQLLEGLDVQVKNMNETRNEFVRVFLDNLYTLQMFFEKHTEKHIEEVIEKKTDSEKEENLKFIEQLNKEARQSFKTMIAIGLDSWKQLTTKDKSLYFETSPPEDEEDHNMSNEDLDAQNRMSAANELGENFTEEQYTEWLNRKNHHEREDQLAHDEMDVMEDDDE